MTYSVPTATTCKTITYNIKPAHLKTFGDPFVPYLRFDQIVNVAQWHRDVFYGPDNVKGFAQAMGTEIMVWTSQTVTNYLRHILPDELTSDVTISFEVPHLKSPA
jgi:hypothetical protein